MSPPDELIDVSDDAEDFFRFTLEQGWGDGLPLVPPTTGRVQAMMAATPREPGDVIARLPPMQGEATVELAAVNAVLAGCAPASFPLVIAALEAVGEPELNGLALTTTTSSAYPVLIVNGPCRSRLGIDYASSCMGGAAGRGSMTIGRAVSLCLRNIGGQRVGVNCKSVFGQPARIGMCFGEWEERSPWPSLACRLGFSRDDDIVTVYGSMGTFPLTDKNCDKPRDLVYLLAKSMAFPLGIKFLAPSPPSGQVVLAINPVWADWLASAFPDMDDLQECLWSNCWQPIDLWPSAVQSILERDGRVDDRGRVHLAARPDQFVVLVCGGYSGLHGVCLPSFGDSELQTRVAAWP